MMVFLSCYTIVDGFFIASFVGKEAFTAVNLVFPVLMAAGTPGFLLGTGGSAFVGAALDGKNLKRRTGSFRFSPRSRSGSDFCFPSSSGS